MFKPQYDSSVHLKLSNAMRIFLKGIGLNSFRKNNYILLFECWLLIIFCKAYRILRIWHTYTENCSVNKNNKKYYIVFSEL